MCLFHLKIHYMILCLFMCGVACLFEMCNHRLDLKVGEKLFVNSPYYPAQYPVGSSCRYLITAPHDCKLKFTCVIKLNTPPAVTKCPNEAVYFNREGSEILTESEYFCGTGKMERKSFLNQAALSYVSTFNYKRILENVTGETKQNEEKYKTKNVERQQTTTTLPTSYKALKVNQLTTMSATQAIDPLDKLLTTSFATTSLTAKDSVALKTKGSENKKVSNSFASVVTFLSNKVDRGAFATNSIAMATSIATKSPKATSTKSRMPRPKSVFNYYGFLPGKSTWRNGSIAALKISTKRVAKVIAGEDYATSELVNSSNASDSSPLNRSRYLSEGGGLFSCLVEVFETPCECGRSPTLKIAGASGAADINEFPSMAGIMTIRNLKIFCGATIIHRRYLLTAAHCLITNERNKPEYLTAVVGEHDVSTVLESLYTRQYDIIKIIAHENFKAISNQLYNDIALLKTRHPIEWNRAVGPACLPFSALKYGTATVPFAGQRVETAGWGTTAFGGPQSALLLKTTLDVLSRTLCQTFISNLPLGTFCTYTPAADTCQYDSGGALYVRTDHLYAVGIVSYGFACATAQPSVNTRVSSYLNWIRSKTPEVKYCVK